jgi:hypothetical protein
MGRVVHGFAPLHSVFAVLGGSDLSVQNLWIALLMGCGNYVIRMAGVCFLAIKVSVSEPAAANPVPPDDKCTRSPLSARNRVWQTKQRQSLLLLLLLLLLLPLLLSAAPLADVIV